MTDRDIDDANQRDNLRIKKRGVSRRTMFRRAAAARATQCAEQNTLAREHLVDEEAGDVVGLTPEGVALVEKMATDGATQNFIAATLVLPRAKWRKLMGKLDEETPARMAYERGAARHEQDIIARLLKAGAKWTPALIHYSKTKLGWREAGTGDPSRVENRINITIPAPMGRGELLQALGQDRIADFRSQRAKRLDDMVDVTPKALPAPAPEPEPAQPESKLAEIQRKAGAFYNGNN
jgi:hypothetical protein